MATPILYRKILHGVEQSFSHIENTPFTQPLHYHEECELIYIISGSGKEFVGDSVTEYKAGDMTLIGSNTPHLHLCNSTIEGYSEKSSCEILQFPLGIFPENISEIKEYSIIHTILTESVLGIRFRSESIIQKVRLLMQEINSKQGIHRIITLYKILDILGKSRSRRFISSLNFQNPPQCYSIDDPINKIYAYLRSNFKKTITLKSIAEYVQQNPSSLCRYFKQKTDKTIFEYLNEIRIEYACKLLTYSDFTNSQIAYEVGYNNLSYFNKVFKYIVHQTPTEYKLSLKKY